MAAHASSMTETGRQVSQDQVLYIGRVQSRKDTTRRGQIQPYRQTPCRLPSFLGRGRVTRVIWGQNIYCSCQMLQTPKCMTTWRLLHRCHLELTHSGRPPWRVPRTCNQLRYNLCCVEAQRFGRQMMEVNSNFTLHSAQLWRRGDRILAGGDDGAGAGAGPSG